MDRRVPPRLTFWTGIWDPTREALSREVDILRRLNGVRHPVISFSPGQTSSLARRERVIRLSGRRWLLLRALGRCVEPLGDLTHVFGPMDAWHLLRAVGRRPVLFTVAVPGPPLEGTLYQKVDLFIAETEPLAAALRDAGISANRIRIIYPGVDLTQFTPAPLPDGRFRVVFASTPSDVADFDRRGIPLMIEAARICPEIDFWLVWRRWGVRGDAERALASLKPPENFRVEYMDVENMPAIFQRSHATIWMAEPGHGKSCPNSVIEGLACGRPAIVSPSCGIGEIVRSGGAGLTPERQPEAVAGAIRALMREPADWTTRARAVAERFFSLSEFCEAYRSVYREMARFTPQNRPD